jgi:drug/metabolite transporter (DMT)-like permease
MERSHEMAQHVALAHRTDRPAPARCGLPRGGSTMSAALRGELLALVALLLFSSNIILTKVASARLSLDAGYLVSVFANIAFAALLFAVQRALRLAPLQWDWIGFAAFAAAGACSTYFGRWFFFEAIARLGPARASVFQVSSPLFTLVIAWIALGERIPSHAVAAIAVAVAGLLLVSVSPASLRRRARAAMPSTAGAARRGGFAAWLRSGMVLGVGSSAAYAAGNVFRATAGRRWDEPVLGALIGAVAALALHGMLTRNNVAMLRRLAGADRIGLAIFALGGAMTISAQMAVIEAMNAVPVAIVALITLCTPLLVFPLSYFLLRNDEGINARTLAGGVLVLGGIAALIIG